MNDLCAGKLADIIDGQLTFGSMPPLGGRSEPVMRVVVDIDRIQAGDVYWELPSERTPASPFAEVAFARGALGVVVAGRYVEPWAGRFSLQVADSGRALYQLARWTRSRFRGTIIGITGRVGKTTTSHMIHTVLSAQLPGNARRDPCRELDELSVAMLELDASDRYGVFELPDDDWQKINDLSALCCPDIAVITGAYNSRHESQDHVESLLSALPDNGWLLLNGDDDHLRCVATRSTAQIVRVGRGPNGDVRADQINFQRGCLCFCVEGQPIRIPVWGRHHLASALAAYAVGRIMELPSHEIARALKTYHVPAGRCQVRQCGLFTVIDDTYNASFRALRAALDVLHDMPASGKRIVVCGDLAEQPRERETAHRRAGEAVVVRCGADLLITCGKQADVVVAAACQAGMPQQHAVACPTVTDALSVLQARLAPGDVVLVSGSRQMQLRQVVDQIAAQPAALVA